MADMPPIDLPNWAELGLRIGAIVGVAVLAYLAVRAVARISVRHILDRRAAAETPEGEEEARPLPGAAETARRVRTIESLVVRVAGAILAVIATLMILSLFQIDIGPAVAGLGVVGIAVGFGAQTLVKDWLAGIFVILENQYSQGDVVRIAGVEGVVEDISLRRTMLRDADGTLHTVPNGQIIVASKLPGRSGSGS
jgi:small-conductance mechanosensitive channel